MSARAGWQDAQLTIFRSADAMQRATTGRARQGAVVAESVLLAAQPSGPTGSSIHSWNQIVVVGGTPGGQRACNDSEPAPSVKRPSTNTSGAGPTRAPLRARPGQ
jgi:hypothetical protein